MKWLAVLCVTFACTISFTNELRAKETVPAAPKKAVGANEAVVKKTPPKTGPIIQTLPGRSYLAQSKNKNYKILLITHHPLRKVAPEDESWEKILVQDKDGKELASVNFAPNSALFNNIYESWSPDGTYIAYYLVNPEGNQERRVLNLDLGVEVSFSPHLISNDGFIEWKQDAPHTAIVMTDKGKVETYPEADKAH